MIAVYGIVDRRAAKARPPMAGLTGERLDVIGAGAISAIVGQWRRAPSPTAANLKKYDRIVRVLAQHNLALLPARFGTHFRDAEELVLVLRSRESSLRQSLRHVRRRVQMTVRMAAASAPVRRRPSGPRKSGADYLHERAGEAARAHDVPEFGKVRDAVRRWVRDERVERRAQIASVYHLIPAGSVDVYRRALDRAAADNNLRLLVTGPWPAYAFAF